MQEPPQMKQNKAGIYILIAGIIASLFLFGCKNLAYNKVATDSQPSKRNQKILLQTCSSRFPSDPPKFIKGKDSLRIDTVTNTITEIETVNDTVFKTVTNTVFIDRWHNRTDTVIQGNAFKETLLISQKNELQTQNTILAQKLEDANKNEKKLNRSRLWGWVAFVGTWTVFFGIYILTKRK